MIFNIELVKLVFISVEAESEDEARDRAVDRDYNFDGAWDRAEPTLVSIFKEED